MGLTTPERKAREAAEAESSDALAKAIADAGSTPTAVAKAIPGRRQQNVSEMADRDQPRSMTIRDVRLMPEEVRVAFLRRMAELDGLLVVTKPRAGSDPASMRLAFELQKETSEATSAVLAMVMDGIAVRSETPGARKELEEAARVIQRALELCDTVDREGVVALHPAGSDR